MITKKFEKFSFNGTSTKTRIETVPSPNLNTIFGSVLMEHPPKQGLKRNQMIMANSPYRVLMEHPPKQGLKQGIKGFPRVANQVLMEHPPKQGLKHIATPFPA